MIKPSHYPIAIFLTAMLAAVLGGCSLLEKPGATKASATPEPRHFPLFYVTNRAPEPDGAGYFSAARGDINFGTATVSIPPGHVMGRHEEPSLLKFETGQDASKHIKLQEVAPLSRDDFAERLGQAIQDSPGKKLMIFVHGYNMSFTEATRALAQFAADLKFNGPVVLFSWPSQGSLTGYAVDETNAEWAQSHFQELMTALLERIPVQHIYLVGHSMGNRIIGRAMATLANERLESDMLRFREIIMIAPDIDAEVFRMDMAPRLARTGIHLTLYASSSDRALRASKAFHGYPRAGESGDGLVVIEGLETIDASDVSGGILGHSYFAEDRRMMEDIYALLQTGQRADQRFGLEAVNSTEGRHWTFRK
ncbi:MAG TPA: alpha/beta fold hydrolase [Gammaproteobacteria bacterium]|nr:alpha/beta fold hydrolase [Gammaproteobacteria bacterium]